MITCAFAPLNASTGVANSLTNAATTSSSNTSLPSSRVGTNQIRIANQAAAWAYINIGTASLAAATVANSIPVAPGSVEVFTIDQSATTVAVILASGTGNVTFTIGEGL